VFLVIAVFGTLGLTPHDGLAQHRVDWLMAPNAIYWMGTDRLGATPLVHRVLDEYFVPVEKFDTFLPLMANIFKKHNVNVINVSIRHAKADPGVTTAWARKETFAFVVYYKQGTSDAAKKEVGVWTREMADAAISVGGAWYLPRLKCTRRWNSF
ncbi:MAG: hypothetical protein PW788_03450, partial [Micavibrio sp.]|nr:hypothetical protein [Micavibrio sp.]